MTWKRIDLAISACIEAEQPLIVIGDGPEHQSLVELAAGSPFVQFVPWLTSDSLATYLKSARAFLFPSHEPFGIAAVEALAAGCPVIAFAKGGSRDFIAEGKNGLLFEAQTVESLVSVLRNFDKHRWNRTEISKTANIFAADNFRSDIEKIVNALPINQSKKENNA